MKMTNFQKTYNASIYATLIVLVIVLLSIILSLASNGITFSGAGPLEPLLHWIKNALESCARYSLLATCIPLTILITLVSVEITERYNSDSISNYFKSVLQTIRLRRFLKQDESSEYITTVDRKQASTRYNPILTKFNREMTKAIVDVRNRTVTVFIRYPKTSQGQKLLKEMTEDVKEELASMNPNYIFSSPIREGNILVFKANHR